VSVKIRLDDLLVELGYFPSKEKARTCIMMNGVEIAGKLANKAGMQINKERFDELYEADSKHLKVDEKLLPYVSRGAFKIEHAYKEFELDFTNKIILDIGSSTGGFTDFALQNGAAKVVALDVGKGQLHYKLQNDERVISLEETNFRDWQMDEIDFRVDVVVCDVSFISIVTILEKLKELIVLNPDKFNPKPEMVFLLKPQFEAGKKIMDKCQGVIKDEKIRREVFHQTLTKIQDLGYKLSSTVDSPITGAKGNVEYLLKLEL
jgi:23S rRNA (cytidine1920-2'-O)/16S rRNA (cytidine1409-2'-O)-methyltransferase